MRGAAFLCTTNMGKLLQHQLIRVQCTRKVPKYWYPLYRSTGTRFKKLFLSIVFTILKKSYFLNIQPVYLGFVCDLPMDLPPGPDVSQTKKNTGSLQRYSSALDMHFKL